MTGAIILFYFITLPNPAELEHKTPPRTAFIMLREDEAAEHHRKLHLQHTIVPLHDISPLAREAVRLSEDASFYEHDGFDFEEMEHAASDALRTGKARGASTISQQLVKNVYLSPSRNPLRKAAEAWLTYRMERALEKDRILELYLNEVEWGDGIFGIQSAAQHYFGESAFALSPAHAVLLAAMLPMPLRVDPRSPSRWLLRRARRLLHELEDLRHISHEEFLAAEAALAH